MSTKTIISVVIALIVIAGLWWFVSMRPSVMPEGLGDYSISPSSSNAALEGDLSNIGKDIETLPADDAAITNSLNDTSVPQEQL